MKNKIASFIALSIVSFSLKAQDKSMLVKPITTKKSEERFTLPPLPYKYNALEPYVDARTMELHHSKHHQKYVDELNRAVNKYPTLKRKSLTALLKNLESVPADVRKSIQNNGGGHANHSLFWKVMAPKKRETPQGTLLKDIQKYSPLFYSDPL